jgi:hypothetical protein
VWSTEADKVDRLHFCLSGAAIKFVCALPEHIWESYHGLTGQMAARFEKKATNHS